MCWDAFVWKTGLFWISCFSQVDWLGSHSVELLGSCMLIGRSVEAKSLLLWTATVLLYELHLRSGCYKCRETNCNQCLGLLCGILQIISILHFIRFIHLYHPLISVVSQWLLKWGMRLPQKNWRRKEKSKQRIESNYFLIIIIKCNLS